jgi:hypothetical protein
MTGSKNERVFTAVISAGRTGTVFLTHWINARVGETVAVHEPPFSRPVYLLGNLFSYYDWNRDVLSRVYLAIRKPRIHRSTAYIELNPFLSPISDLLASGSYALKVAHLVRDPRTWVPSLISHEASGLRKLLTRLAPFNMPRDRQFLDKWNSLTLVEKMLWRWSVFNRKISALENRDCEYELFRYEDIFSSDAETHAKSRDRLARFLDLPTISTTSESLPAEAYNASSKDPRYEFSNWCEGEVAFMQQIAGEQLSKFRYQ